MSTRDINQQLDKNIDAMKRDTQAQRGRLQKQIVEQWATPALRPFLRQTVESYNRASQKNGSNLRLVLPKE